MKVQTFVLALIVFSTASFSQVKTDGYISVDYVNGQEESDFSKGTFQNPLMGIILSGQVSPRMSFVAEATLAQDEKIDISQAWLGLQASRYFNFRLGMYVVPFGGYNEINRPHLTEFIGPPLNVVYLFPFIWRDMGILVNGLISGLSYSVYLGNGLAEQEDLSKGQLFRDNNGNKCLGGKLGFTFSEGFGATYSFYRGKYDDSDNRNLTMQAAHAAWDADAFRVVFEYTKADMQHPDDFSDGKASGYYLQATLNFGSLRPVVSYQWLEYEDGFHGPGFGGEDTPGAGIFEEKNRWTLGVVYSVAENVYLKLEYDYNREKDTEIKNNLLLCQLALSF